MGTLTIRFPQDLDERLRAYAEKEERTRTWVISKALERFLGDPKGDTQLKHLPPGTRVSLPKGAKVPEFDSVVPASTQPLREMTLEQAEEEWLDRLSGESVGSAVAQAPPGESIGAKRAPGIPPDKGERNADRMAGVVNRPVDPASSRRRKCSCGGTENITGHCSKCNQKDRWEE